MKIGRQWQGDEDPTQLLLRPFEDSDADLAALSAVRNETMSAISLPEDFEELTPAQIRDFYERAGSTLAGNAWLLFLAGEPVGAAVVYPTFIFPERQPGNFDMYVVPKLTRHGLGSRLLAHLERAALARGYPVLETTVALEDALSTGFLSGQGFQVVGQSAHLARADMSKLPKVDLPGGFSIAPLPALEDVSDPVEFYRDTANRLGSYDANYSLIRPEEMAALVESGHWQPEGVLYLLDRDGRIVGAIRAGTAGTRRGYLSEIRLEPSSRGKGLGTALVATALRYLADRGVTRVELDTTGENTPAHNLALRAGFKVVRHWLHFLKRLSAA